MPLFRRRERPEYEWARPLADGELDAFLGDLRAELDARGWRYEVRSDALHLVGGEPRVLGLDNLARQYRLVGRAERRGLVREHFDNLVGAEADEIPVDFEAARERLRVRLAGPDDLAAVPGPLVTRPLADDLVAVLAVDAPTAVRLPAREDVAAWGRDDDELFATGLAAVREEPGVVTRAVDLGRARVTAVTGDSFYAATWALWAEELDPPAGEHGAIVAVPHRHVALVHTIRDLGVIEAVNQLAPNAARLHAESPGPISPSVYWVRDGGFERLAVVAGERGTTLVPSDELMDVLNELA